MWIEEVFANRRRGSQGFLRGCAEIEGVTFALLSNNQMSPALIVFA